MARRRTFLDRRNPVPELRKRAGIRKRAEVLPDNVFATPPLPSDVGPTKSRLPWGNGKPPGPQYKGPVPPPGTPDFVGAMKPTAKQNATAAADSIFKRLMRESADRDNAWAAEKRLMGNARALGQGVADAGRFIGSGGATKAISNLADMRKNVIADQDAGAKRLGNNIAGGLSAARGAVKSISDAAPGAISNLANMRKNVIADQDAGAADGVPSSGIPDWVRYALMGGGGIMALYAAKRWLDSNKRRRRDDEEEA